MNKSLQVYELTIDEKAESWVKALAMVERPAISSQFLAFSEDNEPLKFSMNDEKMELIGAAMIPDLKMFRSAKTTPVKEDCYVYFSKDSIRKISQVFFKKGFQSNLNLDHSTQSADSYVFQSFIVDESRGVSSPKGLDLPDGSWVVGVKVENAEVWKEIKDGKRKGFSVEGVFQFLQNEFSDQSTEEAEILRLSNTLNDLLKKFTSNSYKDEQK